MIPRSKIDELQEGLIVRWNDRATAHAKSRLPRREKSGETPYQNDSAIFSLGPFLPCPDRDSLSAFIVAY